MVLYFVSSYLLRYIPTILASGLVLFLGIELTLEAVWESAKDLIWTEWLVAMATLLACTFMGFAPGIGVGLAAAMVVYTGWGCWDMVCVSLPFRQNGHVKTTNWMYFYSAREIVIHRAQLGHPGPTLSTAPALPTS